MNALERAANELPLAILVFAREHDADIVITGADLLFLPDGDITAGWAVAIDRTGITLATGYGRTVLDASLAAVAQVRRRECLEAEEPNLAIEIVVS